MGEAMKTQNVEVLLDKINELKALFIFGHRVFPFLEELFYFVQEVVPLLDEINVSIQESSSRIPKASMQLNKVTEAAEMATTEILDAVDGIVYKLGEIKASIDELQAFCKKQKRAAAKITRCIEEIAQCHPDDKTITSLHRMWQKYQEQSCLSETFKITKTSIEDIKEASSKITISLQVQDITAQQVAAVNHLIESVQTRMQTLLKEFYEVDVAELVEKSNSPPSKKIAFDPDADYLKGRERQQIADTVVNRTQSREVFNQTSVSAVQSKSGKGNGELSASGKSLQERN
jgi:hypothetical protein